MGGVNLKKRNSLNNGEILLTSVGGTKETPNTDEIFRLVSYSKLCDVWSIPYLICHHAQVANAQTDARITETVSSFSFCLIPACWVTTA